MLRFLKRLNHSVFTLADPATHVLEALVFAAFFTTTLLSFYGALSSMFLSAITLTSMTALWLYLTGAMATVHPITPSPLRCDNKLHHYVIAFVIFGLLALAFFMSPDTADEQRTKLARMAMAVRHGSAWETSYVDEMALMYYFPATYYTIFAALEALRPLSFFYPVVNACLVIGSLLNLWLLFGEKRTVKQLFLLVLFIAAPQFLFSGLSGHEEGLTLFLSTRAAVWFIAKPVEFRSIFMLLLCCALAIGVKLTTIIFLPFALLILGYYFGGMERLKLWVDIRVIGKALLAAIPIVLIALLPDLMVNADHGISFADQMNRLGAYHRAKTVACMVGHFNIRLFELAFDFVRIFVNIFSLNLPSPDYSFLPDGCTYDSTKLSVFLTNNSVIRETTQFGLVPVVALVALFLSRGKQRSLVLVSWALFLLSTAIYSAKLMYWSGTSRYFMIGVLMLLPSFLIAVEHFEQRRSAREMKALVFVLLLPAFFVLAAQIDNVPRRLLRGDRTTYIAGTVAEPLRDIAGPVNVYFNDLMPFYTVLSLMPTNDVSLLNRLVPGVTNIIDLPTQYSDSTNWHNDFWLLPIPSPKGEFVFMGKPRKNFGNWVPSNFYKGTPDAPAPGGNGVEIHPIDKGGNIQVWARRLGKTDQVIDIPSRQARQHFISSRGSKQGLCLFETSGSALFWRVETLVECRAVPGP